MRALVTHLRRALASMLRRMASVIGGTAGPEAGPVVEQGGEGDPGVVEAGAAPQRGAERAGVGVPGPPPAHWLELVRAGAPHLLRPTHGSAPAQSAGKPTVGQRAESEPEMERGETKPQMGHAEAEQGMQSTSPENESAQPMAVEKMSDAFAPASQSGGGVEKAGKRAAAAARVVKNPPTHWIERVRQQAPKLLRPGSAVSATVAPAKETAVERSEEPRVELPSEPVAAQSQSRPARVVERTGAPRPADAPRGSVERTTEGQIEWGASSQQPRQSDASVESRGLDPARDEAELTRARGEQLRATQGQTLGRSATAASSAAPVTEKPAVAETAPPESKRSEHGTSAGPVELPYVGAQAESKKAEEGSQPHAPSHRISEALERATSPASRVSREREDEKMHASGNTGVNPGPSHFQSIVAPATPRQRNNPGPPAHAGAKRSNPVAVQASRAASGAMYGVDRSDQDDQGDPGDETDRWPELPDEAEDDHHDDMLAHAKDAERLQRLDQEQRGT
jgi:hypothetical protein